MCVGYQASAFLVGDFEMLSLSSICPMAGKHSVMFRLLTGFFYLTSPKLFETMITLGNTHPVALVLTPDFGSSRSTGYGMRNCLFPSRPIFVQ